MKLNVLKRQQEKVEASQQLSQSVIELMFDLSTITQILRKIPHQFNGSLSLLTLTNENEEVIKCKKSKQEVDLMSCYQRKFFFVLSLIYKPFPQCQIYFICAAWPCFCRSSQVIGIEYHICKTL